MKSLYVWLIASIAALGGLLFGYDWVVIGGAKPFYEAHFAVTSPNLQGWAMSCALVGCLLGALISGALSERFGRKPALQAAAFAFVLSSIGTGLAPTFTAFVLWRITGGLAIGLASSLSPLYIAEVAPAAQRGRLVCLNELTIVFGILLAQITNMFIAGAHADTMTTWQIASAWRWMFGVTAIPAAIFLLGMFFVPESPRWLALRNRTAEARAILERIGGATNADLVLEELAANEEKQAAPRSARTNTRMGAKGVVLLGIGLAVLQQWCGINVLFNYAHDIFRAAGYNLSDTFFNIVVTGVTMVIFTFLAIATVDRSGRRILMLLGCAGLTLVYVVLGWFFHQQSHGIPMLALIVAALAIYAMTLAPVTWVVLSEVFPADIRGQAMAIATASLWAACFVLTYTFPMLVATLGTAGAFWLYAAVCLIGFLSIHRWLPETKGQTLEEIEAALT